MNGLEVALFSSRDMDYYLEVTSTDVIISDIKSMINSKSNIDLRDHFAAVSLSAAMASAYNLGSLEKSDLDALLLKTAEMIYAMADAMMIARGKTA